MNLLTTLKSAVEKLTALKDPLFSVPVAEQRSFLSAFPEPTDDLERAYDQYRCQMKLAGKGTAALYNLAGMVLLPVYRHKLFSAKRPEAKQSCDALFLFGGNLNILPESLQTEFAHLIHLQSFQSHFSLAAEDRDLLSALRKRYPVAFYFRLKCMLKLGMYRWLYEAYHPRALIVSSEYSFTSSFLTAWCQKTGVEHINVMHGEKLFYIRDSFFHFHRCYIWDELYCHLFQDLRAEVTQFRVELPPALRPWFHMQIEKNVDFTYYLQAEDADTLRRIESSLQCLQRDGYVIAVRPHPLYSDQALTTELFGSYLLESPSEIGIEQSVLRTRHAVSLGSTVLYQAYQNGVSVVIDDLSNPAHFQTIRDMQYHMLTVEHTLLSEHCRY